MYVLTAYYLPVRLSSSARSFSVSGIKPPSASACKRVCAVNSHTSKQSNVLKTEVPVTNKQSFFTSTAGRRGVRRPAVSAGSFCQAP